MSGNSSKSPMLNVAGLWAKTSVKGGQYLTGRLGRLKVLVMENRDWKSGDDPRHILYFVEAPDRRQLAREHSDSAEAPAPPRTPQKPSAAQRSGFYARGQRMADHKAPLDHDDAPEWAR
jgi:hypothetical protein